MIVLAILALTALGLLVVYSSSAMDGYLGGSGGTRSRTLGPQLQWAAVGLAGMLVAMRVDYRWLRLVSVPLLLVAGRPPRPASRSRPSRSRSAARRSGCSCPGLPAIQPSELAKLALVDLPRPLDGATRGAPWPASRPASCPFVVIVAPFVLLIFKSPDIGSAGVLGVTAVVMFFLAGANPVYLAGLARPPRRPRPRCSSRTTRPPASSRSPTRSPTRSGRGYHAVQGLLALGLGGLFGAGLGERAAAGGIVLPNAHNDYIFAVIGQEFGFLGRRRP